MKYYLNKKFYISENTLLDFQKITFDYFTKNNKQDIYFKTENFINMYDDICLFDYYQHIFKIPILRDITFIRKTTYDLEQNLFKCIGNNIIIDHSKILKKYISDVNIYQCVTNNVHDVIKQDIFKKIKTPFLLLVEKSTIEKRISNHPGEIIIQLPVAPIKNKKVEPKKARSSIYITLNRAKNMITNKSISETSSKPNLSVFNPNIINKSPNLPRSYSLSQRKILKNKRNSVMIPTNASSELFKHSPSVSNVSLVSSQSSLTKDSRSDKFENLTEIGQHDISKTRRCSTLDSTIDKRPVNNLKSDMGSCEEPIWRVRSSSSSQADRTSNIQNLTQNPIFIPLKTDMDFFSEPLIKEDSIFKSTISKEFFEDVMSRLSISDEEFFNISPRPRAYAFYNPCRKTVFSANEEYLPKKHSIDYSISCASSKESLKKSRHKAILLRGENTLVYLKSKIQTIKFPTLPRKSPKVRRKFKKIDISPPVGDMIHYKTVNSARLSLRSLIKVPSSLSIPDTLEINSQSESKNEPLVERSENNFNKNLISFNLLPHFSREMLLKSGNNSKKRRKVQRSISFAGKQKNFTPLQHMTKAEIAEFLKSEASNKAPTPPPPLPEVPQLRRTIRRKKR